MRFAVGTFFEIEFFGLMRVYIRFVNREIWFAPFD